VRLKDPASPALFFLVFSLRLRIATKLSNVGAVQVLFGQQMDLFEM
jgi:hypothetical protein